MTPLPVALDTAVLTWILGVPVRIAIIIAVALIAQIVLVHLINRIVRRSAGRTRLRKVAEAHVDRHQQELSEQLLTERLAQRAGAIGTLLRSIVYVVVWSLAILTILPLLSIDITPLIASAGVVGLALGFGAQSLVKDYISGIFLILEDQFGISDVVELDNVTGIVEVVSLRYTRLRDADGVIWYIRNGEIRRVANQSQGWTRATVDLSVDQGAALDQVRQVITEASREIAEDPDLRARLLGDPEFAGVQGSVPGAIVVRVLAKVAPENQEAVARMIRERVIGALAASGIPLAGAHDARDDQEPSA